VDGLGDMRRIDLLRPGQFFTSTLKTNKILVFPQADKK
jgi:hypothetical protein